MANAYQCLICYEPYTAERYGRVTKHPCSTRGAAGRVTVHAGGTRLALAGYRRSVPFIGAVASVVALRRVGARL